VNADFVFDIPSHETQQPHWWRQEMGQSSFSLNLTPSPIHQPFLMLEERESAFAASGSQTFTALDFA